MDINNLCLNCLQDKRGDGICPHCHFDSRNSDRVTHQLPVGTILAGKYFVGKVLGEGGFGITYLGFDLNFEMKIAIKEYYPNGFVTRENTATNTVHSYTGEKSEFFQKGRARFIEEARALAKFRTKQGVVSVSDFFLENGTAYIAMEYIEGQTFKEYLAKMGGKLPAQQVLYMMQPVITTLGQIHATGMIHRDISPDNLMITNDGDVKLLDFGAARDFTESGNKSLSVMLKPGYAPEEQYRSRGVQGPWTDIYALCATMYKCITGITPLESNERMIEDDLKRPSSLGVAILPYQEDALMRGLSVFQKNRTQNMKLLYDGLYQAQQEPSKPPKAPEPPKPSRPAPTPEGVNKKEKPDLVALNLKRKSRTASYSAGLIWLNVLSVFLCIVVVVMVVLTGLIEIDLIAAEFVGFVAMLSGLSTVGMLCLASRIYVWNKKSLSIVYEFDNFSQTIIQCYLSNVRTCGIPGKLNGVDVLEIGTMAFAGCYKLEKVLTFSYSIKTIGDYAFYGCDSLIAIPIPKSVTSIGEGAFALCDKLAIYGERDSYAQQYAKEHNIPFRLLKKEPKFTIGRKVKFARL